ncbi:hypothetical protein NBRC10513_004006 [Rhodotorula toruloides]
MLTRHTDRTRYGQEDEDIAYRLQIIGAREGAIRGTLIAGAAVALCVFSSSPANWRFPLVRRQTLAGKAFLVSWGTIFGMIIYAGSLALPPPQHVAHTDKERTDHYLLKWEQDHRIQAERWREMARRELSSKGIIASETTMQKWKSDFDLKNSSPAPLSSATSSSPALQVSESRILEELR